MFQLVYIFKKIYFAYNLLCFKLLKFLLQISSLALTAGKYQQIHTKKIFTFIVIIKTIMNILWSILTKIKYLTFSPFKLTKVERISIISKISLPQKMNVSRREVLPFYCFIQIAMLWHDKDQECLLCLLLLLIQCVLMSVYK